MPESWRNIPTGIDRPNRPERVPVRPSGRGVPGNEGVGPCLHQCGVVFILNFLSVPLSARSARAPRLSSPHRCMQSRPDVWSLVVFVGLLAASWSPGRVQAQNNQLTERSFVSSPVVLGMGDAGVALPGRDQVFFYNPAHLPRTESYFTIFGLQGAASRSLDNHIRFLNDEVAPAVDESSPASEEALSALAPSASSLRRRPGRGSGGILLPSFVYSPGAFGVGGGLFTKTAVNYRLQAGDEPLPAAWLLSRTDVMAVATLGLDLRVLGLSGASVGVTGTRTRRFLAFQNESLETLVGRDPTVRLQGTTTQVDVGGTYRPDWGAIFPGTLHLGGAVYDVLPDDYDYTPGGAGRLPFLDDTVTQPSTDSVFASPETLDRVRGEFELGPSYRIGIGYEQSTLFFLDDVGIAIDYQGYGRGRSLSTSQLHVGARARLGVLRLRAGLSSGYPTGGVGIEAGALEVDYSLHGVESGRSPDRFSSYVHTARLLVRLE